MQPVPSINYFPLLHEMANLPVVLHIGLLCLPFLTHSLVLLSKFLNWCWIFLTGFLPDLLSRSFLRLPTQMLLYIVKNSPSSCHLMSMGPASSNRHFPSSNNEDPNIANLLFRHHLLRFHRSLICIFPVHRNSCIFHSWIGTHAVCDSCCCSANMPGLPFSPFLALGSRLTDWFSHPLRVFRSATP